MSVLRHSTDSSVCCVVFAVSLVSSLLSGDPPRRIKLTLRRLRASLGPAVINNNGTEAVVLYAVDNFIDTFRIQKLNLTSLTWTGESIQYHELVAHTDVTSWPGYPEATRALNGTIILFGGRTSGSVTSSSAILRQVLFDPLTVVHYLVISTFRTITAVAAFSDSIFAYVAVQHVTDEFRCFNLFVLCAGGRGH